MLLPLFIIITVIALLVIVFLLRKLCVSNNLISTLEANNKTLVEQAEVFIENEEKFEMLSDQSLLGIAILQDNQIKFVNQAMSNGNGYTVDEMMTWSIPRLMEVFNPEYREFLIRQIKLKQEGVKSGTKLTYIVGATRKTGEKIWVSVYSKTVKYEGRSADLVIMTDVTDQKNAEILLKEKSTFLNNIIDNIPLSIFWKDKESKYLGCNKNFALNNGFDNPDDIIGKSDKDISPNTARRYIKDDESVVISGVAKLDYEEPKVLKDGTVKTLLTSKVPLRDSNGVITGILGMYTDISEKKFIEEQLHQSHKMDSVGQLAGGIAHDFNNMLGGIMGASELLELKLSGQSDLMVFINMIKESSKRASDLTQQLLEFSRKEKTTSVPMDVHDSISKAIDILERSIDKIIVINQHLSAEIPTIIGDTAQIQNTILNIAINARDAMPQGGTISFKTDNVVFSKQCCGKYNNKISPGKYIVIEIKDTGAGIPNDIKEHIFEPFFTTKSTEKGTGLGLSMVFKTIQRHHGIIDVSSESSGTIFKLFIPCVETDVKDGPETAEVVIGNGTILLADDEPIVRSVTKQILNEIGYDVIVSRDGEETLTKYAENKDEIDLVILDIIMPKMNGAVCFKKIKELDANAKIIAMSGYSRDEIMDDLFKNGLLGFIMKPINRVELSTIVARSINS